MALQSTDNKHELFYQDLCIAMKKHGDVLTPLEILAVLSNLVGKVVALQDQNTLTPNAVMQIVAANIEHGNKHAIEEMKKTGMSLQ